MKSTPLKAEHEAAHAKMVEFAGWYMPVEYLSAETGSAGGIRSEHMHVREKVGLFDVSHMGEIRVRGERALETLQWLTTNDVTKLSNGCAQYSLLPNEKGGVVDDIIVYCVESGRDYLVCVNAANAEKDWAWFQSHNRGADLKNESADWGQVAVQGPRAVELVNRIFTGVAAVAPFHFMPVHFDRALCFAARTGYTGEDGFEIFVPSAQVTKLWRELLSRGSDLEARPIGLGARDTLRTEMKYSLYGHEIDDTTNPYAAGLGWVVKPDAKDFIGKDVMLAQKAAGLKEKLVGFCMVDKGIPRNGYRVLGIDNREIGRVTSGTVSPTLNKSIGIAYVHSDFSPVGSEILIDIRGRGAKARVTATPFVQTALTKKKEN